MDFDPSFIEEKSFDAILPAKALVDMIRANNVDEELAVVLDIGCGPGNTVKLLSQKLKCKHIVGIDIDPQMIEYARLNNQIENTEYLVQDISADWNEWNNNLKKLSGKVSVIFSNYTLHWISDIERTAKNFSKLLSNTGIIVVNVLYCGDIYRNVSHEERQKLEQTLEYPTEQELVGRWVTAFKNAGLSRIDIKYSGPTSIYPEKLYVEEFIKIPIKWYKTFMKLPVTDENIDEMLRDLIIKDRMRKLSEKSPKGENLIEIRQQLWNFVVRK